jgi:hypothetical protein
MRSSMQGPASPRATAVKHAPAVLLTATSGDTGRVPKVAVDRAGPNLVRRFLPRELSLGTDAVAEVSR